MAARKKSGRRKAARRKSRVKRRTARRPTRARKAPRKRARKKAVRRKVRRVRKPLRKKTARKAARPRKAAATRAAPRPAPAKPAPRPPTPARPAAPRDAVAAGVPERIGRVTHYFGHVGAAIVTIESGELRVGDTLHFRGHTTDFYQRIERMEVDHQPVERAGPGQEVGIQIAQRVRENDEVSRVSR